MRRTFSHINNCSWYFYPLGIILFIAGGALIMVPKTDLHLYLNQFNDVTFDGFFKAITLGGAGISIGTVGIIFLLTSYRNFMGMLTAYAVAIGLVQLFKQVIFPHTLRPTLFFHDLGLELYKVPGVENKSYKSFPSGHTTEVFCVITFIVLINQNKWYSAPLLLLACLIGYSRVYLSQHFLSDVFTGAILGTLCAVLAFSYWQNASQTWLNKSLLKK